MKFEGFRKKLLDKKLPEEVKKYKMHYKDKLETGQTVSQLKAKVRDSDLLTYLNSLNVSGTLPLYSVRAPYIFSTYSSIKNNLNNDYVIKKTAWAKYINWANYREDLRKWCDVNLIPELNNIYKDYWLYKTPYSLSPFEPKALVDSLLEYGYNSGNWDTENVKKWTIRANEMHSELKWTSYNLLDVSNSYGECDIENRESVLTAWEELCIACPLFGLIRHDATSGWPDYHKQTIEYILGTYWDAIRAVPDGIVTMYHRRHGYTLTIDKRGVSKLVIKVRFVGGVEYVVKIHGLYITWSFKMSRPSWSLYYRPWTPVFTELSEFIEGYHGIIMTADRRLHDGHHDKMLLNRLFDIVTSTMPEHVLHSHKEEFNGSCRSPKILVSPFEMVKMPVDMATSGTPLIPYYESISADSSATVAIEDQGCEIDKRYIQIDDTLHAFDPNGKFSIDDYCEFERIHFGNEISPTKTEIMDKTITDYKRFIVLLQVVVGELYVDPKSLTFMVPVKTDKTFYHGYIPRKDHREENRERIRLSIAAGGDIIWNDAKLDVSMPESDLINVKRLLGTLGSLGPQIPIELLDLKMKWLSSNRFKKNSFNPIWNNVIEVCRCEPTVLIGEYGFDPYFVIKRINETY